MKKYILSYLENIQRKISENDVDYSELLEYHLKHISFFQHEREVHLLVMILFAILTVLSIGVDIFCFKPAVFLLSVIFLIMTAAYIKHYYFLENSVQKMYHICDEIYKKINEGKLQDEFDLQ
ncbi:MAG: hypothetical protein PUB76_05755 [Oscillospiraceae bacterium]|nr:hypothetical protein [Oscillospiraceae bacterium]MDD6085460.1 hypothetical protein [Oscillospiraceae bacterium]MDY3258407.1 hypothetical protein [Ruminococcus callidus]